MMPTGKEAARWSILQTLQVGGHLGATEPMILAVLQDWMPQYARQAFLRDQLAYLEGRRLLKVERSESRPWRTTLTRHGWDLVDYTIDCEPGIARPPKYWDATSGKAKDGQPQ